MQRRISRVKLEEQGVVTKCSEEVPPYYFSLTVFGNLEVFVRGHSMATLTTLDISEGGGLKKE